jgi:hypothetical protein
MPGYLKDIQGQDVATIVSKLAAWQYISKRRKYTER